jgi:hypothetical protein
VVQEHETSAEVMISGSLPLFVISYSLLTMVPLSTNPKFFLVSGISIFGCDRAASAMKRERVKKTFLK